MRFKKSLLGAQGHLGAPRYQSDDADAGAFDLLFLKNCPIWAIDEKQLGIYR